jgi:hypothetical protein
LETEIKEDTRKWKSSHVHGLAELMLWKWLYYQNQSANSKQHASKSQCYSSQK